MEKGVKMDEAEHPKLALPHYTSAVELLVKARDVATDAAVKQRLAQLATQVLERAEAIKSGAPRRSATTQDALKMVSLFPEAPTAPLPQTASAPAPAPPRAKAPGPAAASRAGVGAGAGAGAGARAGRGRPSQKSLSRGEKAVLKRSSVVNGT